MRVKYLFFLTMLLAGVGLSGCDESGGRPAPIINLGLNTDSATGSIIVGQYDSVYDIAKRYRLPIREIIDINGLEPPYALTEGQRLKLPAPVDYRVQYRDTLQNVANTFGVLASQLVAVNHIPPPYRLKPGQDLRIPSPLRQQQAEASLPAAPMAQHPAPHTPTPRIKEERRQEIPYAPALASSGFIWPVRGKIISGYGPKEDGLYNDGINIAAPYGTPVKAAADGVVAYVGNDLKSYGNLVLIRHNGGTMTAYAHLASISAKKGTAIRKGQVIGTVGATGAVPVSQLHFEIRQGSKTCDPGQYLG